MFCITFLLIRAATKYVSTLQRSEDKLQTTADRPKLNKEEERKNKREYADTFLSEQKRYLSNNNKMQQQHISRRTDKSNQNECALKEKKWRQDRTTRMKQSSMKMMMMRKNTIKELSKMTQRIRICLFRLPNIAELNIHISYWKKVQIIDFLFNES